MAPTTTFTPCPSRRHDYEEGVAFGCLLPVEDGHTRSTGVAHRNAGHGWSTEVEVKESVRRRCTSLHPALTAGAVWRCVENAGHWPGSVHRKNGHPEAVWTDSQSLNPSPGPSDPAAAAVAAIPQVFQSTVDAIVRGWEGLESFLRSRVADEDDRLYDALCQLARLHQAITPAPTCGDLFVLPGEQREDAYTCDGRPDHLATGVMHGGSNRTGRTAAWGDKAGLKDHPGEPTLIKLSQLRDVIKHQEHVIDQLAGQLEDQHRRVEAARLAVAWFAGHDRVGTLTLAEGTALFERYLLDGTAFNVPLSPTTQEGTPMNDEHPLPEPTDTEKPPPVTYMRDTRTVDGQQYRDMQRDTVGLEAIRAWWANNDPATLIGEHQGDAVAATLALLECHQGTCRH